MFCEAVCRHMLSCHPSVYPGCVCLFFIPIMRGSEVSHKSNAPSDVVSLRGAEWSRRRRGASSWGLQNWCDLLALVGVTLKNQNHSASGSATVSPLINLHPPLWAPHSELVVCVRAGRAADSELCWILSECLVHNYIMSDSETGLMEKESY